MALDSLSPVTVTWAEAVQVAKEATVPTWDRLLVIAGIVTGWAIALTTFLWRVGITPIQRNINGVGQRTAALEEWKERADERWRAAELDKQRWDTALSSHAGEMGEIRSEMKGLRDHMDDVKMDILVAIKESGEKSEQQFRELRDRLKDVEVTMRERNRGTGDER